MNIKAAWAAFEARFDTLNQRERVFAFVTAAVLVVFGGWQFAVAPALQQIDRHRTEITSLTGETDALQLRLAEAQAALGESPTATLQAQRHQRKARLDRTQQRLEALAANLISPEGMVALLRQMLKGKDGLTLVSVTHAPAEAENPDDGAKGQPGLYRHRVTLTVRGAYFDLVAYLQALEALDSRLGWHAMRYNVAQWPEGELQVELVTLSLSEEWLGV